MTAEDLIIGFLPYHHSKLIKQRRKVHLSIDVEQTGILKNERKLKKYQEETRRTMMYNVQWKLGSKYSNSCEETMGRSMISQDEIGSIENKLNGFKSFSMLLKS